MEQPENLKLLRSAAVALPLSPDPWEALATGFRVPRSAIVGALKQMIDEGIVVGIRGEPNPALAGAVATVGPPGAPGVLRWRGIATNGRIIEARTQFRGGSEALRFFKIGTPPIVETGVDALLGNDQDRTCLVEVFPTPVERLPDPDEALAEQLLAPFRFDPNANPWEEIGARVSRSPAEVVTSVRRLVITRRWRRIGLAFNPTKAGWAGCGLARWTMGPSEVNDAAKALAALRSTGDVFVQSGGTDNLTALFMARLPGEGERAAAEVARQWGRPLSSWQPLELE